jgi:hypothetical protein
MLIRIQHFGQCVSGSSVLNEQKWQNFTTLKKSCNFLSLGLYEGYPATREASRPLKSTYST